jgi:hypothetical protein
MAFIRARIVIYVQWIYRCRNGSHHFKTHSIAAPAYFKMTVIDLFGGSS